MITYMRSKVDLPPRILTLTLLPAALAAFAAFSFAQTRPAPNPNAPAGSAQKGKDAFAAHMCATCHGPEGQAAVVPALAPPPRPIPDFTRYVRQPAGTTPPFTPQAASDAHLSRTSRFL